MLMSKNSIVIGMGIGQLYQQVLNDLGYTVVTVDADPAKGAEFTDVDSAIEKYKNFDTAHICTPNFTHAELAEKLAPYTKIIFVEKPGVENSKSWQNLVKSYSNTRIVMVKNNQWRNNITELTELVENSYMVDIKWINDDRVPSPGTWFTTKSLAYGGVSRDLMPHLLSLFMVLEPNYKQAIQTKNSARTVWQLSDFTKTDYGTINKNGVYDVDDVCSLSFKTDNTEWNLTADWRSCAGDERCITFYLNPTKNGSDSNITVSVELGLCPEYAYKNMIEDCVKNLNNNEFWQHQLEQDYYIHEKVEQIEM